MSGNLSFHRKPISISKQEPEKVQQKDLKKRLGKERGTRYIRSAPPNPQNHGFEIVVRRQREAMSTPCVSERGIARVLLLRILRSRVVSLVGDLGCWIASVRVREWGG